MIKKPRLWLLMLLLLAELGFSVQGQGPVSQRTREIATGRRWAEAASAGGEGSAAEPESGVMTDGFYDNKYFALRYPPPANWIETVKGPPPSDAGYYVLDSFKAGPTSDGKSKGTMLIAAWDLFFVPRPARNALELVKDIRGSLPPVYEVEKAPAEVKIGGHSFVRFDYGSSAAQLHWRVLATEIRCHMVEFVLAGRDPAVLEELVRGMNKLQLPEGTGATSGTGGGPFPACVRDYASGSNIIHKVEPVMAGPRFTSVPVRVIIGTDGKARHIHVISASPEQAKSVRDALAQWLFKPYIRDGVPAEVETGLLFKFPPDGAKLPPLPEKY